MKDTEIKRGSGSINYKKNWTIPRTTFFQ